MDAVTQLWGSPDPTSALGTPAPELPPGQLQPTERDHHFHGPTPPDVANRRSRTASRILKMYLPMAKAATCPARGHGAKSSGLM